MKQGIKVKTTKRGGLYTSFIVSGHAMSAPKGEDIVCAAVSILTQSTLIAVQKRIPCSFGVSEGLVYCNIHDDHKDVERSKIVQALIGSMIHGLQMTDSSYPGYLIFEEQVISS